MAEMAVVNDSDSDESRTDQLSPAAEILDKISQWILDESDGSFEDLETDLSVNQLLQEAVAGYMVTFHTSEILVDVMKFLIRCGANVNYQDLTNPYLLTMLHHAVRNGLVGEAKLLIENGANVNALCVELDAHLPQGPDDPDFPEGFSITVQTSCLIMAIQNGDLNMTELLLSHGADLSHAVRRGALNYRADMADLPFLEYLVDHGADVGLVLDEIDEQRPLLLVDKLFQKACNKERQLHSIMEPPFTGYFDRFRSIESYLREHERFLDCLKFVLSEKAPTVTKEGLSCFSTLNDAFRDGCFLTICRLYFYSVTNAIPVVLPDALPEMIQAMSSFFVPSGPLVLAKMLRNWPPLGKISNNLIAGLETFAGMIPGNPGAPTLKILCMSRIRLSLCKSTFNFQCLDRLKELGLPPSLHSEITMKDLIHQLEDDIQMAFELCRLCGLIVDI